MCLNIVNASKEEQTNPVPTPKYLLRKKNNTYKHLNKEI